MNTDALEKLFSEPVFTLARDLSMAYPGLYERFYEDLAWEAFNRSSGRAGGKDWAMSVAKLEWLRVNGDSVADNMDQEYFG